ncbi:putative peptidase M23-like protein [metagenome]|uniref:Putative peptidase M23-like protein n=1 Tax=metagenome TaxID=256318 RepID=A0A2P2CDN8_9ZZZZ
MGNHRAASRAPKRDAAAPANVAGKRKAVKHAAARGPLFRGLPSAPVLLGVAALAISAGGAVTMGNADKVASAADDFQFSSSAGALNGANGVAQVSSKNRGSEASRDSGRGAQAASSDTKLQKAAEAQAEVRSQVLTKAMASAEKQADKIEENLWILPVDGYHLTNTFGMARSYYSSVHTGLDFACPSGTPIHAIADGVITSFEYDGSYGNKTVMTLDDGTEIWYAHQTSYASDLSIGEEVRQGQVIGYVGSTGNSTGPHVHIEVRPGAGDPVDPYPAFQVHGVTP